MKALILLFALISIQVQASDFYGCEQEVKDYVITEIYSDQSIFSQDDLAAMAKVEMIDFSETHGQGDYEVTIGKIQYYVAVTLWWDYGDEYTCTVNLEDSYKL